MPRRRILFIKPFGTDRYNSVVSRILNQVKRSDTRVLVTNLRRGPTYGDFYYYRYFMMDELIERAIQAEKDGYDGVVFGSFLDPAVIEARENVDIPVIGTHEPTIHLAAMLGHRFAVITNSNKSIPAVANLVRLFGLESKCVGCGAIQMSLDEMFNSPQKCKDKTLEAVTWAKERGADVLVNGCTIQSAYFVDGAGLSQDAFQISGIVVLDPNIVGLKTMEMLVDLNKIGIGISRNSLFGKPKDFSVNDYEAVRKMFNKD